MALKKKLKKKAAPKKKTVKKKAVVSKKKPVRKQTKPKKKPALKKKSKSLSIGKVVGVVTHYFPKVRAAVIKVSSVLSVGDNIKIKGHTTDLAQSIDSIQLDHVSINSAKKGQEIGLLVNSRVRQQDTVYKV
ncbi:MAG: hypothetical protein HZC15_05085 [Candidatus Omnitrophica bacterium]|nr:hypothetical protein [Candidatus Omnitrophota bacterium]